MVNAGCRCGCLAVPSGENEGQRGRVRGKATAAGSTKRLSHMLPHVRVRRAGTGAALCKSLPAACGTAREPHMFVLWSSNTGGLRMARLHRTGAFCLEPLVMSLPPPPPPLSPVCVCVCVCSPICLCVCVVPVCLPSTLPFIILPSPSATLWLTSGAERGQQLGWGGRGGGTQRGGGGRGEAGRDGGQIRKKKKLTPFPCRQSRDQKQPTT